MRIFSRLSTPDTIQSFKAYFHTKLNAVFDPDEVDAVFSWTIEYYLGYSRADSSLKSADFLPETVSEKIVRVIDRLIEGEPLQYILGETWFCGLKIKLNKNVLIPRPETEELVEWIIQSLTGLNLSGRSSSLEEVTLTILDIGTGSGCIAIALKKLLPQVEVFGLDISIEALAIAKQNALLNKVNIQFVQGDILNVDSQSLTKSIPIQFDLIVSNPPYILPSEIKDMRRNVLEHEPHLALFVSENDPLQYYKAIIGFARKYLRQEGVLFLEINESRGIELLALLQEQGFNALEIKKDISGKDRMVKVKFIQ